MRKRRRNAVRRDDRIEPTRQTLAKLQPDPLAILLDSDPARECRCGKAALEEAADEIRSVYMAVCRMVMRKGGLMMDVGGMPDIPDALAWAHARTYVPWANHWGHTRVLEAVIDVVVDRYQSPHASVIVVALSDYAKRMYERPRQERAA